MTSIINAGVDGIVLTASSTAALNIQAGGTNAIQISTGAATTITNATITTLTTSNPLVFPAGSAPAPAVTTTGDTNTGIYFPAADQVAVTTGGTVAAAFNSNGLFFRNRVINGDMRIDQRNAGAAVTHSGASNLYVLDRWVCNSTGTPQFSVQQVADAPTGFVNSSKLTTTTAGTPAAGDFSYYTQYIEGLNVADLNFGTASALTVTLSFWVKSSLTGTFGGALKNGASNRAYPFSYTITSAGTWEYKTVTIPGDTTGTWLTTNDRGMSVAFDTGSGANNKGTAGAWNATANIGVTGGVNLVATAAATWQITGVQLETGSVATPFERRPYGTELMLCQRYYEKSYEAATAPGAATTTNIIYSQSVSSAIRSANNVPFMVLKRSAATVRVWDQAGNATRTSRYDATTGLLVQNNNNNIAVLSGLTTGILISIAQAANEFCAFQWDASAEI